MNTIPFNKLKYLTFIDINESLDNLFLLDSEGLSGNKYDDVQSNLLWLAWLEITDDFFALSKDEVSKRRLREKVDVMTLVLKINNLTNTVNTLRLLHGSGEHLTMETYGEMEQLAYSIIKKTESRVNIQYFDGIAKNIEITERIIRALNTQYKLKYKNVRKQTNAEKLNIYDEVRAVGEIVGFRIEIENMVCPEWLAWKNRALEKSKPKNGSKR